MRRGGVAGAMRLFGPGAIIASVTIGSGETTFASRAGAIFGYGLLWFILAVVLCKLIQVYSGARYMVLAGEHPMEAWTRLPGPRGWFPAFLGLMSVGCFPFWIGLLTLMLGSALNWITGLDARGHAEQLLYARLFGTATILLAVTLTLVQTYRTFEKVQTAIVGVLLAAIVVAAGFAPVNWGELIRGAFLVEIPDYAPWVHEKYPLIVAKESVLLAMVTFMAAIGGGTYDYIGYLSLFREKAWGALGAETPWAEHAAKPAFEPSEVNLARGRSWIRAPVIDVFVGFGCVLVFTMAFNILGAAILHPEHNVPDKFKVLTPQVVFLTQFGAGFKYIYQAGIFMAFWGTIYGAFEIYSRTAYECFRPLVSGVRRMPYARFRLPVCLYAGIGGLILLWTSEDPIAIVHPITPLATLTCGIWCFAMIWTDRRMLPAPLRMNAIWLALNLAAGTILTAFGAKAMWDQFV